MTDSRTQARNRGKAHERRIAAALGGERVPSPGRERGYAPDVAHPRWSIECKAWSKVPLYLSDAMEQAVKSVRGEQVPVVILHVKGKRSENDYVVLRMKNFMEVTGGGSVVCGDEACGAGEGATGGGWCARSTEHGGDVRGGDGNAPAVHETATQ